MVRLLLITVEKLLLKDAYPNLYFTQLREEILQSRFRKRKHFKAFMKHKMEREFPL